VRSLDYNQAAVLNQTVVHQMQVNDADLATTGATYWWQAGYIVPNEAESNRGDNIGSRQFVPSWNGSGWDLPETGGMLHGSILQRWSGASVASNTNGVDDGRCFVAVVVTGPVNGLWHYEYAVHNRDNHRGLGAFRVPVCAAARVQDVGFHDIDANPLDDWVGAKVGAEIVWSTTSNPLHWNSIFNFWFDCDAAPVPGAPLALDQYSVGPGALSVAVLSTAPVGLYDQDLGPGCGSPVTPILFADGAPQRATLGNASFVLRSANNPAATACGFVLTTTPGATILGGGCTLYSATWSGLLGPFMVVADANGIGSMPLAIPNDPSFEGLGLDLQAANIVTGGSYLGSFNFSNGLRVRVGSLIAGCP
jgi:hypothetical protein